MSRAQTGLTMIEVLVALAIFGLVVIGAVGAVGATASGFLETVPTGLLTSRLAKDTTAAAVYLQALHEHAATVGGSGVAAGTTTYTPADASGPFGFSLPLSVPYQLAWDTLTVTLQTWTWTGTAYAPGSCDPATEADCVVLIRSTLSWTLKGPRSLTVQRFLPP